MWEQDWALLGIEPTTELAAIKKAYALKLRVTRPDDDAEAYQALRGAYERVQQWLRWQQQAATDSPPPGMPAEAAVVGTGSEPDTANPPAVPEEPLQPGRSLNQLVAATDALWREQGGAALAEAWPAINRQLDEVPLANQAECATLFAQWVLDQPALPDPFVSALNQHFGWLDDFRAERQIGTALVQALHEALDGRLVGQTAGPALRREAGPLLHLHRVLDRGWGAAAPALAAIIGPGLQRLYRSLGAGSLRRLGLRQPEQQQLKAAFDFAFALRLALCVLPLLLLGLARAPTHEALAWSLLRWLGVGLAGVGLAYLGSACLERGFAPRGAHSRYRMWLDRWRLQSWTPWLGLALLAAAVWLSHEHPATDRAMASAMDVAMKAPVDGVKSIGIIDRETMRWAFWVDVLTPQLLGLLGLVIAWPLAVMHGRVIAGQVLLLTLIIQMGIAGSLRDLWSGLTESWLMQVMQGRTGLATTWLGCWLWLIVGALVHEQRLRGLGWLVWLVRPVANLLAIGDRWGLPLALAPAFLTAGVLFLLDLKLGTSSILVLWAVLIVALSHLQNALEPHGLRWLDRLAASSAA